MSKYVGESEASVRAIFSEAWDQASQLESRCAVVFFDEIDALGQARCGMGGGGGGGSSSGDGEGGGCSRRVLAELLLQLNIVSDGKYQPQQQLSEEGGKHASVAPVGDDNYNDGSSSLGDHGVDGSCSSNDEAGRTTSHPFVRVIVVGASNRPQDCDAALLRRFGLRLYVGLPSRKDRKKLLVRLLGDIDHCISSSQFSIIAESTDGWSYSDLEVLAREAAMAPVRECIQKAARLRKSRATQSGGVASGQEDGDQPSDTDALSRDTLLADFQSLRFVTIKDFERAIEFWLGNDENMGSFCMDAVVSCPSSSRYDSSSDEGEE